MVGFDIRMPSWLSKEQAITAVSCASGILFSDYVAATLIAASKQTGMAALGVGVGTKVALGFGLCYGATKTSGALQTVLGIAGIGSFASTAIDVFRVAWPAVTGASARIAAATRARQVAVVTPTVRLAPAMAQPAGIRIRAETPEAYALGGF